MFFDHLKTFNRNTVSLCMDLENFSTFPFFGSCDDNYFIATFYMKFCKLRHIR